MIKSGSGRKLQNNFDLTITPDHDDYMLERVRRERAYAWHSRLGMPSYNQMKQAVKTSKGLDITVDDVDLLPWTENAMLNRREYERMVAEDEARVQKAKQKFRQEEMMRKKRQQDEARERERMEAAARRAEEERQRRLAEEERARQKALEEKAKQEARRKAEEERRRKAKEEALRRKKEEEERKRREEEDRRRKAEEEARLRREAEEAERQKRLAEENRLKELARLQKEKEDEEFNRLKKQQAEQRQRRSLAKLKPPQLTDGETPIERAYRCWTLLSQPKRTTMFAALDKTEGLELIEGDIETLPFEKDGRTLNYSKLIDLLHREERKRKVRQPIMNLWIEQAKFARPTKPEMKENIAEWTNGEMEADDVSLMSWDAEGEVLMVRDWEDEERAARLRKQVKERKKIEQEERDRLMAPVRRRKMRSQRPPPVTLGNTPLENAYRWYTRLSGPHRREMYRSSDEGVDIKRSDIDTLPWIKDGAILDFAKLGEMLDELENQRKRRGTADDGSGTGILNEAERRRQAYNWYKKLKRPRRATFYQLVDETFGTNMESDDVDLLPWNDDNTAIDETKLPKGLREGRSSRRVSIGHSFGK